jgi:hypothetical protein
MTGSLNQSLDRTAVILSLVEFGIPVLLFAAASHLVAEGGMYKVSGLFQAYATRVRKWDLLWGEAVFEKRLPWVLSSLCLLLLCPLLLLIIWGGVAAATVNIYFGLTIALVGPALACGWYAFRHWTHNEFRPSRPAIVLGLCAAGLVVAYQLAIVFMADTRDFIGLSAVFLSFQVLPAISLIHRLARGRLLRLSEHEKTAQNLETSWLHSSDSLADGWQASSNEDTAHEFHSRADEKTQTSIVPEDIKFDVKSPKDMKSGDNKNVGASHAENTSVDANSRRRFDTWNFCLAGIAVGVLIAYGVVNQLVGASSRASVGFITAGAVLSVDVLLGINSQMSLLSL